MSIVLSFSADVEGGQSAPVSESGEDAAGRGNDDRPQVTRPPCFVLQLVSQLAPMTDVMGSPMHRPV